VANSARLINHTEKVLLHTRKIVLAALDNETGSRGFTITGVETFLEPLLAGKRNIHAEIEQLRLLIENNPDQLPLLDSLKYYVNKRIEFSDSMVLVRQEKGLQAVIAMVETETGKQYSDHIRRIGSKMEKNETNLLEQRKRRNDKNVADLNIILYSIMAVLFVSGIYIINRIKKDMNERKRSEEAIMQLNKELESFTYSVSHDLRAPLRIIDGYADILVTDYTDKLDEEGNRVLNIVKSNARKMGQLIDDLLNFSHIGRREVVRHYTDMTPLVRSIIDEQLANTGADTKIGIEELEPAFVDSSLIRQVWVNLVSNALKYSRKKDPALVEIKSVKQGGDIIYSIKDNGAGFNMKYADKLFGVFQRLHKPTEFEGTGIGLALANRIVTKHGGKIWAESEVGNGATFFFSIPVSTA
jgi:signal transduction histidine kinase